MFTQHKIKHLSNKVLAKEIETWDHVPSTSRSSRVGYYTKI